MRAVRQMAILVGGLALIVVGVALLVLPGPGLVIILAGLALLSTEFPWAARLLESVRRQVRSGTRFSRRDGGRG